MDCHQLGDFKFEPDGWDIRFIETKMHLNLMSCTVQ